MTHSGGRADHHPRRISCRGGRDQAIIEATVYLLPTADQARPTSVTPYAEGATDLQNPVGTDPSRTGYQFAGSIGCSAAERCLAACRTSF